jgi:hypothetical protein
MTIDNEKVWPDEAHVYTDASFYKVGLRGLVFAWTGDEWIRSQKSPKEIIAAVKQYTKSEIHLLQKQIEYVAAREQRILKEIRSRVPKHPGTK